MDCLESQMSGRPKRSHRELDPHLSRQPPEYRVSCRLFGGSRAVVYRTVCDVETVVCLADSPRENPVSDFGDRHVWPTVV